MIYPVFFKKNNMSYNTENNKKMSKKSMFIQKRMDNSIPNNIMTSIAHWIDCYNDTIKERTKIKMHMDFESKINDTDYTTSSIKMSRSGKKSESERMKYEKDIFGWLALMTDEDLDYYSDKISEHMKITKDLIIKNYVNTIRIEKKIKVFDPNYKSKKFEKDEKEIKKEDNKKPENTNEKVLYGDAWDLI